MTEQTAQTRELIGQLIVSTTQLAAVLQSLNAWIGQVDYRLEVLEQQIHVDEHWSPLEAALRRE